MATLTMEQRVAQLLMVPIYARTDTAGWGEAERWTRDLGLGGVICMQGGPDHQRVRLKRLQALASIPLMVSSDAEWGLGMRLDNAILSAGDDSRRHAQRGIGRDVWASGRTKSSPRASMSNRLVVDVNSNPINPVIGSRSFGESVEWVSKLGQAYADGLQEQGEASAKHFLDMVTATADFTPPCRPFCTTVRPEFWWSVARSDTLEHGMGGVMVAHLDVPGLDSTQAQPSTLSPAIVDTLLYQRTSLWLMPSTP